MPEGDRFEWAPSSTYVRQPPYFKGMSKERPTSVDEIRGARVIAVLGDSVTTDHISPAGSIKKDSPAGRYLIAQGVTPADFNSYGSRRGNHEVLVRGTFANTRIRNRLAPGTEGGVTTYLPTGEVMSIYDAAMRYQAAGTPLLVLAGKEYGSGSSRDWAAKGPALQGIRAVIAESYERIHRSNLVGMGILPLQFTPGQSVESLGLTGREVYDLEGLAHAIETAFAAGRTLVVNARRDDGTAVRFEVTIRIDTPQEVLYYQHGGILQYVLRQLLWGRQKARAIGPGPSDHAGVAAQRQESGRGIEGVVPRQRPAGVLTGRKDGRTEGGKVCDWAVGLRSYIPWTPPSRLPHSQLPRIRSTNARSAGPTTRKNTGAGIRIWIRAVVPGGADVSWCDSTDGEHGGRTVGAAGHPAWLRDPPGGSPGISFRRSEANGAGVTGFSGDRRTVWGRWSSIALTLLARLPARTASAERERPRRTIHAAPRRRRYTQTCKAPAGPSRAGPAADRIPARPSRA